MEVERLRQILREEIRKVFREELRSTILEAVQIASTPEKYRESNPVKASKPTIGVGAKSRSVSKSPISDLLESTKQSMTKEDYDDIVGSGFDVGFSEPVVMSENQSPEISDIVSDPLPDFAKRAGAVFNRSMQIKPNALQH